MARIPYNPFKKQQMKSDCPNLPSERAYLVRQHLSAAQAAAADTDGILVNTELTTARTITTGFNDPPYARALTYDCSAAGVTGDVTVVGTNIADEEITETKALNGTNVVAGALAFKTITSIALPAKVHTKAKQSFTKQVTAASASKAGNVTLALTAAALGDASPLSVVVALLKDDAVGVIAGKMISALNADDDFKAAFVASLSGTDKVLVTRLVEAADDNTLAMAFTDTDSTGATMGADGDKVAGVAPDLVFVGFGDIIGLQYMSSWNNVAYVTLNGVKETSAWTQVADSNELEKNTIDLNSALNGTAVNIYSIIDNE